MEWIKNEKNIITSIWSFENFFTGKLFNISACFYFKNGTGKFINFPGHGTVWK